MPMRIAPLLRRLILPFQRNVHGERRLEVRQKISIGQPHAPEPHLIDRVIPQFILLVRPRVGLKLRGRSRRRQRGRRILPRLTPPDPQAHERRAGRVERRETRRAPLPRQFRRRVRRRIAARGQRRRIAKGRPDPGGHVRTESPPPEVRRRLLLVLAHDVIGRRQNDSTCAARARRLEDVEAVIHAAGALGPVGVGVRVDRAEVDQGVGSVEGLRPAVAFLHARLDVADVSERHLGRGMDVLLLEVGRMLDESNAVLRRVVTQEMVRELRAEISGPSGNHHDGGRRRGTVAVGW
mmetsp:Transcript_20110/g.58154  ORF Transcript_20110/g.58154 Transcript_20110/m.58154 type:complete len:294 (+) Transcript_20110:355-1236(+)